MIDSQYIIILISILIIFSYLFDLFARKTKFPSVILLMVTGIVGRTVADYFGYEILYMDQLIPLMGSIGLVLIVLEGALELEVTKKKLKIIGRSFLSALTLLVAISAALTYVFTHYMDLPFESAFLHAVALSVISSAVAIPSASSLEEDDKEFVVYESTFSDILGIMLFNYALDQFAHKEPLLGVAPIGFMVLKISLVILFSAIVVWLLFQLMGRLNHKVKFFLIFAILMIVYSLGKYYHSPLLVTIFVFGIFLANTQSFFPRFVRRNLPIRKATEGLHEFHLLTAESTFLVRTFFFLLFGFLITINDFIDDWNIYTTGGIIIVTMLIIRTIYFLTVERKRSKALIFFSPRGLISILLFWRLQSGEYSHFKSELINEQVLFVVIVGTMIVMMVGSVGFGKKKRPEPDYDEDELDYE
ncbi:MAG: cation:proton antiporter [Moheibacter sp.]